MIVWFAWFVVALGLIVCAYAAQRTVRNLGLDDPLLFATAALAVLLLVQLVIGLVLVTRSAPPQLDTPTFVAYLIAVPFLPPAAIAWSLLERSRWGPAVIALAGFAGAVMTLRLIALWSPNAV